MAVARLLFGSSCRRCRRGRVLKLTMTRKGSKALGAHEASSPLRFRTPARRKHTTDFRASLARSAASLGLRWRFLWLGHPGLRLWAAWGSGV